MEDRAVVIELRRLAAAVADLTDEHQHLHRRLTAREDKRLAAALWPLLGELVGAACFTGPGVYATAVDQRTAIGAAVCQLVVEYGSEDGGLRAFGWFLGRMAGVPIGGLRLVRVDETRDGVRYRLQRVSAAGNPQA